MTVNATKNAVNVFKKSTDHSHDGSDNPVKRSKYIETPECTVCFIPFLKLKRKHCKRCKYSVCDQCAKTRRKITVNSAFPERVCDACETELENEAHIKEIEEKYIKEL